jgi:hypothetical protein
MQYHPETQAHLAAKEFFATALPAWKAELRAATCEIEYRIPEARRIADLCFLFPDGRRVAVEIQFSSISQQEIRRRTEAYHRAGMWVWWMLGKDAAQHKPTVYAWYGSVGTVEVIDTEVTWQPFGPFVMSGELPPGWHTAPCDHKGNQSQFGDYWTPVRSDGHSPGVYLHRESAVFWANRDQQGQQQ